MNFFKNITDIFSHPISVLTLLGLLIIIIALIKAKKIKFNTHIIAQIGLALALATILKIFRLYRFPQGGSVTLGSMVPILLIALIYGAETGFLTGFLYGLISLIMDPYILHPVQVLFDYPLPFLVLGLAGYFRNKGIKLRLLGIFLAIFARYICHVLSGVIFFGNFAPEGTSPIVYSLLLNGSYLSVECIICLIILSLLPLDLLKRIATKNQTINFQ